MKKRPAKKMHWLLFVMAVISAASVQASVIEAINDTYVDENRADGNQGGWDQLGVKDNAGGYNMMTYVQFDISGLGFSTEELAGQTSASVTFNIKGMGSPWATTPYQNVELYVIPTGKEVDWSESLSWTDAATVYGQSDENLTADAVKIGETETITGAKQDDGSYVWDKTSITFSDANLLSVIQADADGIVDFLVVAPDIGNGNPTLYLASSENSSLDGPSLSVIPEPATIGLLGLGSIALMALRRRFN